MRPRNTFAFFLACLTTTITYFPILGSAEFLTPQATDGSGSQAPGNFDFTIHWVIGDTVTVRWNTEWNGISLRLWQGVLGVAWSWQEFFHDADNAGYYEWKVAPVLDYAQTWQMHFQLLLSADETQFFNSMDFKVYNRTETSTETFAGTTIERTITQQVTVTPPSQDAGISSSPLSSPVEEETVTTPEPSSTSESSTDTQEAAGAKTSESGPPAEKTTSPDNSSNDTAMKVGLGVGLGVGLPLLAALGIGFYLLGRRRGGLGEKHLPSMPAAPTYQTQDMASSWYHPHAQVGGIDNLGSREGGGAMGRGYR